MQFGTIRGEYVCLMNTEETFLWKSCTELAKGFRPRTDKAIAVLKKLKTKKKKKECFSKHKEAEKKKAEGFFLSWEEVYIF